MKWVVTTRDDCLLVEAESEDEARRKAGNQLKDGEEGIEKVEEHVR
jgi:hypothetical protein